MTVGGCSCGGTCLVCKPPARRPEFAVLSGEAYEHTLTGEMIPVADTLRNLLTCFGQRPYQVRLVWTQWSGGKRGIGVEQVVRVKRLLPTPLVESIDAITLTVQPIGLDEVGNARVREISGTYTEEFLRGLGPNGEEIPKEQNFYYEVLFPRAEPELPLLRRFSLRGTPAFQPEQFGWTVGLMRSTEDRERSGTPST